MNKVTLKEELIGLSDTKLNKLVSIKNTDYNRNVKYGTRTKRIWKQLHDGPAAMSISEIASGWGASYTTVKKAVDPEFAEKIKSTRGIYDKKYYDTHDISYKPGYIANLAAHKRAIISSSELAHLKTL